MIDLHAHLLPGVDDGPTDLEEAVTMARQAAAAGIKKVALTPHWDFIPNWQEIQRKTESLQKALDQENLDLKLYPGGELYLDLDICHMGVEDLPTYANNGKYLLLEFPFHDIPLYTSQVIFELQVKGITPIIAHPERNHLIMQEPNLLLEWIDAGCLTQVNSGSLLGVFGGKTQEAAQSIISHGMAHILASDAHSTGGRAFNLDKGFQQAAKYIGERKAYELVLNNPEKVIAGLEIKIPKPQPIRAEKRWWFFRRR